MQREERLNAIKNWLRTEEMSLPIFLVGGLFNFFPIDAQKTSSVDR